MPTGNTHMPTGNTHMPGGAPHVPTGAPHVPGGAPQAAEGLVAKAMQNKKLLGAGAVGLGALGLGGALYARHRHNQQAAAQKTGSLADHLPGPDTTAVDPEIMQRYNDRVAKTVGVTGAIGGGVAGGLAGAALHGARGAAIGVPLGALATGLGTYGGARGGMALRKRMDAGREATKGQDVINGKMVLRGPQWLQRLTRAAADEGTYASPEEVAAAQKQAAYKQAEPVLADMMGGYDSAALHPEVQKSLAHRTALLSALGAGVPLAALGATMGGDIFGTNRAALIGGGLGALGGGAAGYALSHAADAAQLRHDADRQATKGMGVVAGKLDPRVHGPHTSLVNRIFTGGNNVATPEEVAAHVQSQG